MVLVLDSALEQIVQLSYHQNDGQLTRPPDVMPRAFHIEGLSHGKWDTVARVENNYQRLVRVSVGKELEGVRYTLDATWGSDSSRIFAFYVA